jgi:hypothetical protein
VCIRVCEQIDFVVDVHVQGPPHGIDELTDPGRAIDVQRFAAVHLGGEHEDPRESRHVIRMGVGNEDAGDLLPAEVQAAKPYLGALAAVEKEQLPFPAHENRGQSPSRQGHHPARAQHEYFEVHGASFLIPGGP